MRFFPWFSIGFLLISFLVLFSVLCSIVLPTFSYSIFFAVTFSIFHYLFQFQYCLSYTATFPISYSNNFLAVLFPFLSFFLVSFTVFLDSLYVSLKSTTCFFSYFVLLVKNVFTSPVSISASFFPPLLRKPSLAVSLLSINRVCTILTAS